MAITRRILGLASAAFLTAGAGELHAQSAPADRNHLYDRFQLSGSLTGVWIGPKIRIDASNGSPGTEVNTGNLGLGKTSVEPRLGVRWRPGRRHEIEGSYLLARSNGDRTVSDTIVFADTSFAAGLRIKSAFNSDQASLTYRFAFRARERSQIGVALGLGALFFKLDIDAQASLGGAQAAYSASKSVTAPTASLGLYGRWRSGSRWYIETDARALWFSVGRITATVAEAGVAGRYFMSPRFGVEGGYGFTAVNVTLDPNAAGGGVSGQLRYTLQNLRLGVIFVP